MNTRLHRSTALLTFAALAIFMSSQTATAQRRDAAASARRTSARQTATQNTNGQGMTASPEPQMQAVLDRLAALKPKPIETLTAGEARYQPAFVDALKNTIQIKQRGAYPQPEAVGKVHDLMITGAAGQIPARIYTPAGTGPFPVIVYYHGGGWVIASINAYDASARALTNAARAVVISVEYRKGPEHKFPAAHDDAFAAYQWTLANAAGIGGDPRKIAVVGESAGGNLACNVSIMARDRSVQLPVHQVLVYPIANNDLNAPSVVENTSRSLPLRRAMIGWFLENYLNSQAESADPRIALVRANLRGLPPTTIINAQIDPLRSEGELLAERMRAAGVQVEQRTYDGVTHEFFGMGAVVDKAKQAVQQAATGLRSGFDRR